MTTRHINGTQKYLQQVQGPAGLKAIGVGRYTAHGMHGDRPTNEAIVLAPGPVGPLAFDFDGFLERDMGHFQRQTLNGVGV
jgi:hypothetical protein